MKLYLLILLLLVVPLGTSSITIRGDSINYESLGDLDNINNFNLRGEPLFIFDTTTNQLKAFFNLPRDQSPASALPQFNPIIPDSSNTTTGFIGNVDNFDNIDGFSRFRETNLNNGTSASSGFIGVNNLGFNISMGIASNNFQLGNVSIGNIGAIRLISPADMFFLNDFLTSWRWVTDANNGTGFSVPREVMSLSPEGNLSILGNFTADRLFGNFFGVYDWKTPDIFLDFNGTDLELDISAVSQNLIIPHGEMFVTENLNSTIITVAGVYVDIEVFDEGLTNNMTYNNSALIADLNGTYKLDYAITFIDSNNRNYKSTVGINGNATNKCVAARRLQSNDFGNIGSTCILSLVAGDNITLQIQNIGFTDNVIITDGNLNMMKLG